MTEEPVWGDAFLLTVPPNGGLPAKNPGLKYRPVMGTAPFTSR